MKNMKKKFISLCCGLLLGCTLLTTPQAAVQAANNKAVTAFVQETYYMYPEDAKAVKTGETKIKLNSSKAEKTGDFWISFKASKAGTYKFNFSNAKYTRFDKNDYNGTDTTYDMDVLAYRYSRDNGWTTQKVSGALIKDYAFDLIDARYWGCMENKLYKSEYYTDAENKANFKAGKKKMKDWYGYTDNQTVSLKMKKGQTIYFVIHPSYKEPLGNSGSFTLKVTKK